MAALDLPYEEYVRINGGEHCGICGRTRAELPNSTRLLDRDHAHVGAGIARGLLCRECNRKLKRWLTLEWGRLAVEYLKRADERKMRP